MKKQTELLYIIIALLLLFSCSVKTTSSQDDVTFTVIHVNDRHGRMDADPYISQMVKDLRIKGGNVLIFDAGDALHGQITANITKGASMVRVMNAVGYSAMVPGNHEFNYGVERLFELEKMMNFPFLCANVTKYGEYIFNGYHIFFVNEHKIGVFGITTPETPSSSDPRQMEGLKFEDPRQTAYRLVAELQELGCGYIIALVHLGSKETSLPENTVDAIVVPGVDLIVDGHSHTFLKNGRMVGSTLIVQTGEYGQHIGIVKVLLDEESNSQQASTIDVSPYLAADEAIITIINQENESTEYLTEQIIGYTPFLLKGERADVRSAATNLSDLITDSMRFNIEADISFITGGSIRSSIPAGDITMGHALNTMPFSNLIVTKQIKGTDIWEALERGVSAYPYEAAYFLHFSGLQVKFDPEAEAGQRIVSVTKLQNIAFDKEQTYKVAMIEFLAMGGDGYEMFAKGDDIVYYGGDVEAFVSYLVTDPIIYETSDGRMVTLVSR